MAYNPDLHIVSNKPYGMAQGDPVDARTYYYDADIFAYRAYQDTSEVLAYLNSDAARRGHFSVIINFDGTLDLDTGLYDGGTYQEWWFKDGVEDENLVPKWFGLQTVISNDNALTGDNIIQQGGNALTFNGTGDFTVSSPNIFFTGLTNTGDQILTLDENNRLVFVDMPEVGRFGIEDILGAQNRAVDMQGFDFTLTQADDINLFGDDIFFSNDAGISKQTLADNAGSDRYMPLSVNGQFADSLGEITLSVPDAVRFGIEDNIGVQNRAMDAEHYTFTWDNLQWMDMYARDVDNPTTKYSELYFDTTSLYLATTDIGATTSSGLSLNPDNFAIAASSSSHNNAILTWSGVNHAMSLNSSEGMLFNHGVGNSGFPDGERAYISYKFLTSEMKKGFLIQGMATADKDAIVTTGDALLGYHGLLVHQTEALVGDSYFYHWNGADSWYKMLAIHEADAYNSDATKFLTIDSDGFVILATPSGGGSATADNGLHIDGGSGDVYLGGTLLQDTLVEVDNFLLTVLGTSSTPSLTALNSSSGTALLASATTGLGVDGYSTDGSGVTGTSVNSVGTRGYSTNGAAGVFVSTNLTGIDAQTYNTNGYASAIFTTGIGNAGLDTVIQNVVVRRVASGTPDDGIGSSIDFDTSTDSSNDYSNKIISKWADATHATRTSEFIITGIGSAFESDLLTLSGGGELQLNHYGSGTKTGTPTFALAVDSAGNVIEESLWKIILTAGYSNLGPTVGASTTAYGQLTGVSSGFVTGETGRLFIITEACIAKNLFVLVSGTQHASGNLVITLRKNQADTAITITIPAGATSGTFSDTTHTASLVAGDTLSIEYDNLATSASITMLSNAVSLASA